MIKVYKDLNVYDFRNEFEGLYNTSWANEYEALGVLYDYLESMGVESHEETNIRDWLRFQVIEMTSEEIEENYNVEFVGYSDINYFLNDYTVLYGTYESNGETYYLFSEF